MRVDSLLDTVNGLPVHALIVHAVVVLLPLATVGAMLMIAWPSFGRRFGVLVVIVAGIGAGSAVIARLSGEQLAERVGTPVPHADLGAWLPAIAIGFFVVVAAYWLFARGIPQNRPRPGWLVGLGVVVVLASLFTLWWTIRVGDSGANAVWSGIIESTNPR